MSTDTSTESDGDSSSNSDTDAIICGGTDSGSSLISDPNIASSSSTSSDDDLVIVSGASSSRLDQNDHPQEIRIFNVDFRALSACSNTNKEEKEGLASNNRLKSACANTSVSFYNISASDFMDVVQKLTGSSSSSSLIEKRVSPAVSISVDPMDIQPLKRKRPSPLSLPRPGFGKKFDEEQVVVMKKVKTEDRVPTVAAAPLLPSSWTAIWDSADGKGIFDVPPLSPLSPLPLPQLLMI